MAANHRVLFWKSLQGSELLLEEFKTKLGRQFSSISHCLYGKYGHVMFKAQKFYPDLSLNISYENTLHIKYLFLPYKEILIIFVLAYFVYLFFLNKKMFTGSLQCAKYRTSVRADIKMGHTFKAGHHCRAQYHGPVVCNQRNFAPTTLPGDIQQQREIFWAVQLGSANSI